MALTLKGILRRTPKIVHERGAYVSIKEMKKGVNRRTKRVAVRAIVKSRATPGIITGRRQHVVKIDAVKPTKLGYPDKLSAVHVKVSCDCEFFAYNCEVALHKYGAADIVFSNGEDPVETNPRMIPLCCKHIVKVANAVINRNM